MLGKPYATGTSSWDRARTRERSGANVAPKHRGPREDESPFAPVMHERNYERQPRRKMREVKRGTEGDRKRKRNRRELKENISKGRPKEARVEGHMLKRVLSPGGNRRDRLTVGLYQLREGFSFVNLFN